MEKGTKMNSKLRFIALCIFQWTPKLVEGMKCKKGFRKETITKVSKDLFTNFFLCFLQFCYEEAVALVQVRV